MTRLLFLGDIVGRSGREAVAAHVPRLREHLALDLVVANGENAAGGFGITLKIVAELVAAGVDVVTTGNHVWDQRELVGTIDQEPRLLRPGNLVRGAPGRGAALFTLPDRRKVLVVNVLGRLYMDAVDDPFAFVDEQLALHRLGATVAAVLIDVHAEASSEKIGMAHHTDGRASLVVGSHTHVPTADARILPRGTGFQSDAGMCGDYDSVIGMKTETALARMVRRMPTEKLEAAQGPGTLCGVFAELDPATGLCRRVAPVRLGPHLAPVVPEPIGAAVPGSVLAVP